VSAALLIAIFVSNLPEGIGSAAGALLVMLVDSMIPEARSKGSDITGLVTVVGLAVAIVLANA